MKFAVIGTGINYANEFTDFADYFICRYSALVSFQCQNSSSSKQLWHTYLIFSGMRNVVEKYVIKNCFSITLKNLSSGKQSYLEDDAVYVSCNCPNSPYNTDFSVNGMEPFPMPMGVCSLCTFWCTGNTCRNLTRNNTYRSGMKLYGQDQYGKIRFLVPAALAWGRRDLLSNYLVCRFMKVEMKDYTEIDNSLGRELLNTMAHKSSSTAAMLTSTVLSFLSMERAESLDLKENKTQAEADKCIKNGAAIEKIRLEAEYSLDYSDIVENNNLTIWKDLSQLFGLWWSVSADSVEKFGTIIVDVVATDKHLINPSEVRETNPVIVTEMIDQIDVYSDMAKSQNDSSSSAHLPHKPSPAAAAVCAQCQNLMHSLGVDSISSGQKRLYPNYLYLCTKPTHCSLSVFHDVLSRPDGTSRPQWPRGPLAQPSLCLGRCPEPRWPGQPCGAASLPGCSAGLRQAHGTASVPSPSPRILTFCTSESSRHESASDNVFLQWQRTLSNSAGNEDTWISRDFMKEVKYDDCINFADGEFKMMGWTTKLGVKATSARLVEMTAYQIDGPHLFELLLIKQGSAGKMVFTENVLPVSGFWTTTLVLICSPEEFERGRFRDFGAVLKTGSLNRFQKWASESFGIQYDDRCHPADAYKLQCKPFLGMSLAKRKELGSWSSPTNLYDMLGNIKISYPGRESEIEIISCTCYIQLIYECIELIRIGILWHPKIHPESQVVLPMLTKAHTKGKRSHPGGLQRYKDGLRKAKVLGNVDLVFLVLQMQILRKEHPPRNTKYREKYKHFQFSPAGSLKDIGNINAFDTLFVTNWKRSKTSNCQEVCWKDSVSHNASCIITREGGLCEQRQLAMSLSEPACGTQEKGKSCFMELAELFRNVSGNREGEKFSFLYQLKEGRGLVLSTLVSGEGYEPSGKSATIKSLRCVLAILESCQEDDTRGFYGYLAGKDMIYFYSDNSSVIKNSFFGCTTIIVTVPGLAGTGCFFLYGMFLPIGTASRQPLKSWLLLWKTIPKRKASDSNRSGDFVTLPIRTLELHWCKSAKGRTPLGVPNQRAHTWTFCSGFWLCQKKQLNDVMDSRKNGDVWHIFSNGVKETLSLTKCALIEPWKTLASFQYNTHLSSAQKAAYLERSQQGRVRGGCHSGRLTDAYSYLPGAAQHLVQKESYSFYLFLKEERQQVPVLFIRPVPNTPSTLRREEVKQGVASHIGLAVWDFMPYGEEVYYRSLCQLHFLFLLMTLVLGLGTAYVESEVQNQTAPYPFYTDQQSFNLK
ncbi:hypothetical protein DV515_00004903 [Chloebia gouldiae]|uniref:Uncharacterized protein n=1 Tax=Chloebia gouldiae TaxID=44316 RepID=A0A3L8SPE3_CHLGU|nr:hypothetical protein DV515_00004903 [Chloebia gouldiae]